MPTRQTPFRLGDDTLAELADLAASNGGNLTTAVKEMAAQFRRLVEEAGRQNADEIEAEDWVRLCHLNDPDPYSGLDLDDEAGLPSRYGVDWSQALAAELVGMWEGRDSSLELHRRERRACEDLARQVAGLGRLRGYALMCALRYFWRHPEAGAAVCRAVEVWLTPTARKEEER